MGLDFTLMFYFAFETAVLFLVSTILFDVIHFFLHNWQNSRFKIFKAFSRWHDYHHRFLDEQMTMQHKWTKRNIIFHVIPEYITAIIAICLGSFLFSKYAVIMTIVLHSVFVILRIFARGTDINHTEINRLSARKSILYVNPTYHFMHHIYPKQFFSSFLGLFDLVIGSACAIKGRRFLITGASGAFGQSMKEQIEKLGGIVKTIKFQRDYTYHNYSAFDDLLKETDVLILAHGSKYKHAMQANCHSFIHIIETYILLSKNRLLPPEVWALGSEIECHGTFGIKKLRPYYNSKIRFAKKAREYYSSKDIIYRHIIPSAFTSGMGKGLITARFAVIWALFLIKRGFYYIPVSYTGLGYLNYIRFRYFT